MCDGVFVGGLKRGVSRVAWEWAMLGSGFTRLKSAWLGAEVWCMHVRCYWPLSHAVDRAFAVRRWTGGFAEALCREVVLGAGERPATAGCVHTASLNTHHS